MTTLLTVLHVIVCLFLMLTVLLQKGKGGGMGGAFGGGNAATVFGGSGASSFLKRLTAAAVTIFMLDSMTLAFLASRNSGDALEKFGEQEQQRAHEKEASRAAAHKLNGGSGEVAPGAPGSAEGSGMIMLGSGESLPTDDETMGSAGSAPTTPPTEAGSGTSMGSPGSAFAPKPTAPKNVEPKNVELKPKAAEPKATEPKATKPAEPTPAPEPAGSAAPATP